MFTCICNVCAYVYVCVYVDVYVDVSALLFLGGSPTRAPGGPVQGGRHRTMCLFSSVFYVMLFVSFCVMYMCYLFVESRRRTTSAPTSARSPRGRA